MDEEKLAKRIELAKKHLRRDEYWRYVSAEDYEDAKQKVKELERLYNILYGFI